MDALAYPSFTCQTCGKQNTLEIDRSEGFPQSFVWDCQRCCHAHDITVRESTDERLNVSVNAI